MNKVNELLVLGLFLFSLATPQLQVGHATSIRGIVTAFAGQELRVKTPEGEDLQVNIEKDTNINILFSLQMNDIKPGDFVGVTAVSKGPGTPLQAREVHLIPEAKRGTGEGHREWDLEPGSTMTNGNVDAIVTTNDGKELTLSYKGGRQKIIVPHGVPIVAFRPADQSLLKPGVRVFIMTRQAADGGLTAQSINVGKDNTPPPM